MIIRKKNYQIGDFVTMKHCWGGYRLPNEIPEGAVVKVISKDTSKVLICFEEKQFSVSEACVVSGWEYRLNGIWRDEKDPMVTAQIRSGRLNSA